jgi:molecular chaperone GrpE (heat shock protein)
MIINYPTGLYSTVLPKGQEAGNVTYLISNTIPPRSDLLFPKVPIGIVEKKFRQRDIVIVKRRDTFGELIFSISKASRQEEGNNAKQFEIGRILEFNDESGKSVQPMFVAATTEMRHDTNILNYDQMGLTAEEQRAVSELSLVTQDALTESLNEHRRLRADAEQVINVNQKLINDLTKTIDSLEITLDYSPTTGSAHTEASTVEQLLLKLKARRDQAFKARDQAINNADIYANEAANTMDQLRAVGLLVK